MKKAIYVLIVILWHAYGLYAQVNFSDCIGEYGDWMPNGSSLTTKLILRADSTFELRSVDNVFPQTFQYYTNSGHWLLQHGEVILNPALEKRHPAVVLTEKTVGLKDSIQIKVNYYLELYEDNKWVERKESDFELLTLFFNKKKKYVHLTRESYDLGSCAWAPRIKRRINIDSANTFKVARQELDKIGVYSYGFTEFIELPIQNRASDYLEIEIVVPVDKERMPRSKKVIIKGKKAYFYEVNGKVAKLLTPLYKKAEQ